MEMALYPARNIGLSTILLSMAHQGVHMYRKYSIVIGQTKILPVIQEKRQNAIENIFSIARELRKNAATVTFSTR